MIGVFEWCFNNYKESIMTNQLIIANTPIPVDADNRINLNALHRASGLGEHKRPSKWLATKSTKELIEELENQSPYSGFGSAATDTGISVSPINSFKGGINQGTFAHQLLAISYAGWISPAFQLQVNQVFLHSKTQVSQPEPLLSDSDMVINKDKYIGLLEQTLELLQTEQQKQQQQARQKAKRRPSTPLSDEEVNNIHQLAANGLSQKQIAQRLNRSSATVSYILRSDSLQGDTL
jgi:hypothetical protein